jgi:hypothetical protein
MLKQVQELQKYLKDKKIPSSGAKKDLVHRVKMHQDSISRQRGGLGEGGMSLNRIVGGESCGTGAGEGGGSKRGGGEGEREWERGESMVVGFMTKEERGEGMRTCRNLRTTMTTARRMRRGWRRRDYLHPQKMMRIIWYNC